MDTKKPTALLLEDEPLIAMDLELTLQGAGFEVAHLRSCSEADHWLSSNRPDVAIVDIILADGSCHDVVAKLRNLEVPFVVHSGDLPHQHARTPFEFGVWLTKPSASGELIVAIRLATAT